MPTTIDNEDSDSDDCENDLAIMEAAFAFGAGNLSLENIDDALDGSDDDGGPKSGHRRGGAALRHDNQQQQQDAQQVLEDLHLHVPVTKTKGFKFTSNKKRKSATTTPTPPKEVEQHKHQIQDKNDNKQEKGRRQQRFKKVLSGASMRNFMGQKQQSVRELVGQQRQSVRNLMVRAKTNNSSSTNGDDDGDNSSAGSPFRRRSSNFSPTDLSFDSQRRSSSDNFSAAEVSFGSQGTSVGGDGTSEDDDDEGDFLVDFPTNREELMEQRREEEQHHHHVPSDDSSVGSGRRARRAVEEVDQRKPWRRSGIGSSSIMVEVTGTDKNDSFRKQKEEVAKEYEDIGFYFENEEIVKAKDDEDDSQLTNEEEATDVGNNHDDDTSVLSELLFAQTALGWTESKSEYSQHSSSHRNNASQGLLGASGTRITGALEPTAEEATSNDEESLQPYKQFDDEVKDREELARAAFLKTNLSEPYPVPEAEKATNTNMKMTIRQKLLAARKALNLAIQNKSLPNHGDLKEEKETAPPSNLSNHDDLKEEKKDESPSSLPHVAIPNVDDSLNDAEELKDSSSRSRARRRPSDASKNSLKSSSSHLPHRSHSPKPPTGRQLRSLSHENLAGMMAASPNDKHMKRSHSTPDVNPNTTKERGESSSNATPPRIPSQYRRGLSFGAKSEADQGRVTAHLALPQRSQSFSATPVSKEKKDEPERRASEQIGSEISAAAMATFMSTTTLDASSRKGGHQGSSDVDDSGAALSDDDENELKADSEKAKAEGDDKHNRRHKRRRRHHRHHRRKHVEGEDEEGDDDDNERRRRSKSRHRHRSRSRRHKEGDGEDVDNDDDEGHRSRRSKSRRKHHRSRSRHGKIDGQQKSSKRKVSDDHEEKPENEQDANALAAMKGMFAIPGDDSLRTPEDSKEEERIDSASPVEAAATFGAIVANLASENGAPTADVGKVPSDASKINETDQNTASPPILHANSIDDTPIADHFVPLGKGESKEDTTRRMDDGTPPKRRRPLKEASASSLSSKETLQGLAIGSVASQTSMEASNTSLSILSKANSKMSKEQDSSSTLAFSTIAGLANFKRVFSASVRNKKAEEQTNFKSVWSDDDSAYTAEEDLEAPTPSNRLKANLKVTMRTTSWGLKMQRICGPRLWAMKWYIVGGIILFILILAIAIPLASRGKKSPPSPPTLAPNTAPSPPPTSEPTADIGYAEFADILGSDAGDSAGTSTAMSSDGRYLAIGYPQSSVGAGMVRIFERDGDEYLPYGDAIPGIAPGDTFGFSISLSDDGQTVVIGSPTGDDNLGYVVVFRYNTLSSAWMRLGNVITSTVPEGRAGSAVSISGDGRRVAVGVPRANDLDGVTLVFNYNALTQLWIRLGQRIVGSEAELNGFSLALDETGETLAIGAVRSPGPFNRRGRVYVLHLSDNGQWFQFGNAMVGDGDNFGRSVSISDSGRRLAVGAPGFDTPTEDDVGSCQVFAYLGRRWEQLGPTLTGERGDERSGYSVALSRDGDRLACGGPGGDTVRLYRQEGAALWEARSVLEGMRATLFGTAVAMNGDGDIVAVGAPEESVGGQSNIGLVRIYQD